MRSVSPCRSRTVLLAAGATLGSAGAATPPRPCCRPSWATPLNLRTPTPARFFTFGNDPDGTKIRYAWGVGSGFSALSEAASFDAGSRSPPTATTRSRSRSATAWAAKRSFAWTVRTRTANEGPYPYEAYLFNNDPGFVFSRADLAGGGAYLETSWLDDAPPRTPSPSTRPP